MIGPLGVYLLLAAMVAAHGAGPVHGFWRLFALAVFLTPVLVFLYLLVLERSMAGQS